MWILGLECQVLFKSLERFSRTFLQHSTQFNQSRSIWGFVSLLPCLFVLLLGLLFPVSFTDYCLHNQWAGIKNKRGCLLLLCHLICRVKGGLLQTFLDILSWEIFYSKWSMKVLVHSQQPRASKAGLRRRVLSSVMNRMTIREFQEALWYGRGIHSKANRGQQGNKEWSRLVGPGTNWRAPALSEGAAPPRLMAARPSRGPMLPNLPIFKRNW